jgi:Family of unknown function (DUF6174)
MEVRMPYLVSSDLHGSTVFHRLARILPIVLLLSAACGHDAFGPASVRDIDRAEARWNAAHLTNYHFELHESCVWTCLGTWTVVTVHGGQVTSVVNEDTGEVLPISRGRTIAEIFVMLRGMAGASNSALEAQFSSSRGFPVRWDNNSRIPDTGYGGEARGLTPEP